LTIAITLITGPFGRLAEVGVPDIRAFTHHDE
jgi:hypothetical protein